jgi:hypothetical protein
MHAELNRPTHRRITLFLVLFVLFAPKVGAQTSVLKTGAGAVAHNMCSSTFVSGLAEKETYDELVGALIGCAKFLARYRVDRVSKAVDASLLFCTCPRGIYARVWISARVWRGWRNSNTRSVGDEGDAR